MAGNILCGYFQETIGWRFVFFVFTAAGAILGLLSWIIVRDTPVEHPAISLQELKLIEADDHPLFTGSAAGSSFRQFMKDPWLWANAAYNFFYSFTFWANLNWRPTYFVIARGTSVLKSGYLFSLPRLAGLLGLLTLGAISDRI